MYKIAVPVINAMVTTIGPEAFWEELKRLDAERVFLVVDVSHPDGEKAKKDFRDLKANAAYFHARGLEVGSWCWTLELFDASYHYAMMTSPTGKVSKSRICPSDENYRELFGRYVENLAATGVDLIMFDDDFRYGYQDMGCGCTCENHVKMIADILGEPVDWETLKSHIFAGGKNRYRDAFIRANGKAMEDFARSLRRHADSVNPNLRMGFCSCLTNWDIDGTHPDKIARLAAGNTKPFYRLIGAPYWGAMKCWGCRLADAIELERMELGFCKEKDIEIFAEGDVYPRPRFRIPAAYVEGFDTALRASGGLDGILKYGIDYHSNPNYETGYRVRHENHRPLYGQIDEIFGDKKSVGVRVYETPAKFAAFNVPSCAEGSDGVQDIFFSYAAKMMNACAIPTTYEGTGNGGIVFGVNAAFLPEDALRHGLILDAEAAEILTGKGIDVGVKAFGGSAYSANEIFDVYGNVFLENAEVRCLKLKDGVIPLSRFAVGADTQFADRNGEIPAAFRYENDKGQKFLVLCFNAYALNGYFTQDGLYRQYTRARQIIDAVSWFGHPLPASMQGQPDLYLQTKKDEKGNLAIGIWNFCEDDFVNGVAVTDDNYRVKKTVGCEASLDGNRLLLSRIEPFGFAALELEKI